MRSPALVALCLLTVSSAAAEAPAPRLHLGFEQGLSDDGSGDLDPRITLAEPSETDRFTPGVRGSGVILSEPLVIEAENLVPAVQMWGDVPFSAWENGRWRMLTVVRRDDRRRVRMDDVLVARAKDVVRNPTKAGQYLSIAAGSRVVDEFSL